jgi:FkbM family methyltransferase
MNYNFFAQVRSDLKFRFKVITKKTLSLVFSRFGFKISINSTNDFIVSRNIEEILSKIKIANTIISIQKINNVKFKEFIFNNIQYLDEGIQVLWILFVFECKENGYFVEFGACDGLLFSNTKILEKDFGWKGILAEPNRSYGNQIVENRKVIIDKRAVWSKTGVSVEFAEVSAGGLSGIYSTFRRNKNDLDKRQSLGIKKYTVETVSLNDLLNEYKAPVNFDLLSIDTEGSEYEIIENFDLNKYRPKVICIEFDGTKFELNKFEKILSRYGYKSVGAEFSEERNLWFMLD